MIISTRMMRLEIDRLTLLLFIVASFALVRHLQSASRGVALDGPTPSFETAFRPILQGQGNAVAGLSALAKGTVVG